MNFGSKKVFMYAEPEFEVVSDEEYEHGMSVRYVSLFAHRVCWMALFPSVD